MDSEKIGMLKKELEILLQEKYKDKPLTDDRHENIVRENDIERLRNGVNEPITSLGIKEKEAIRLFLGQAVEQIEIILRKYLDLNEEYYSIIALWIVGTYYHNEFISYPYLFFNAMRGSGKSRALKIISSLSKDGMYSMSPTESVLFRTKGTLCLDEIESIAGKDKQSIREVLNASYKKGVTVMRMKRKKTAAGEEQVVEKFEPYRPLCMANIWGMEEVLGDRSITLILEKSNDKSKTSLLEIWEQEEEYQNALKMLKSLIQCSLCSVVTDKNIYKEYNVYISCTYTNIHTYTNYTNYTTPTITEELKDIELTSFFNKLNESGITGRNLELFFPLILLAFIIDKDILLKRIIETAKNITAERKHEEEVESYDVLVYEFVSRFDSVLNHLSVKDLTANFRSSYELSEDWLNAKWFGRSLKRLGLIVNKRRVGQGIEVLLNSNKAKEKLKIFQKESEQK
jgi:hypothetical protein